MADNGLLMRIETSQANQSLQATTQVGEKFLAGLDQQNKTLTALEAHLKGVAAAHTAAADATRRHTAAQAAANQEAARAFNSTKRGLTPLNQVGSQGLFAGSGLGDDLSRGAEQNAVRAAQNADKLARSATAASTAVVTVAGAAGVADRSLSKAGASAAMTAGFFTRMAGQGRAAGAIAGGFRLLATALNPIPLIVGAGAAALITWAINAAAAATATDKLSEEAREAQKNFDLMSEASQRTAENMKELATARAATFGLPAGDQDLAIDRLQQFADKVQTTIGGLGKAPLNITVIKDMADALRLSADDVGRLEKASKAAASGDIKELDIQLKALKETGLEIHKKFGEGFFDDKILHPALLLDSADAANILRGQLNKTNLQIVELRNGIVTSAAPYKQLLDDLRKEAELAKLGNKEREVTIALDRLKARSPASGLTAEQAQAAAVAIGIARKADAEVGHSKALDRVNRAMERRVQLERADSQDAREKHAKGLDRINKAMEKRVQLEQKLTDEQAANAAQRSSTVQQLNENADILLARTEKEVEAKTRLAKVNDILRQTGEKPGSAAGAEIDRALQRVEAATKFAAQLQEVRQIGADVGATIGQGLLQGAYAGDKLSKSLANIVHQLSLMAAQRVIVDNLAKIGAAFAGSFFGPTQPGAGSPSPAGTGTGTNGALGPVLRARGGQISGDGGPLEFAANGMVLDRVTTLLRGGRRIQTNEGGASTPEAVIPLKRDKFGRLGVIAADGAGGGGDTFNFDLSGVRSADEARRIRPTIQQTIRSMHRNGQRWRGGMRGG